MSKINPLASRVTVTDGPGGLGLLIPPNGTGLSSCLWDSGCVFGQWVEIMVPIQFLNGDLPGITVIFVLAWSGAWTVGGVFAIYLWLWNLMGRQVITMHGHTLTTRRDIGGYGFEKEYDLTQVRDLRASAMGDYSASLQFFGLGGGLSPLIMEPRLIGLGQDWTKQMPNLW